MVGKRLTGLHGAKTQKTAIFKDLRYLQIHKSELSISELQHKNFYRVVTNVSYEYSSIFRVDFPW
jgi:hypothetical protein